MSLFSRIPTRTVSEDLPYVHVVDFAAYAKRIASLGCQFQDCGDETVSSSNGCGSGPIHRIAAIEDKIEALRMVLASSNTNNAWISGPRGSGKTSLVEALLRLRAEERVSSRLLATPIMLFDVIAFFKLPRQEWMPRFDTAMKTLIEKKGLVIIDHFDDFVRMADGEASRLVNTFVSTLENHDDVQAIVVSEDEHNAEILEASSGMDRRFQQISLSGTLTDAETKTILMAQFRYLEARHHIDLTEEVADEILRLLGRYPGRAFTMAAPRNAVTLADKVGTHVALGKYAEPKQVAVLRISIGALSDKIAVFQPQSPEDEARKEAMRAERAVLQADYAKQEDAWRAKYGPVVKARQDLALLDSRIAPLRDKTQRDEAEEQKYALLKRSFTEQQVKLAEAERALHPLPPRVTLEDVRTVFARESGVPLSSLSADRMEFLAKLPAALDAEIFSQDVAKKTLARAYSARELAVCDPSRPAAVLFFAGGTGLGKTELVKVLARYDGGESAEPVTLEMNAFKSASSGSKLIGADPGLVGYDQGSPYLAPVQKNGRSIVLFDEIEKADSSVFDVLMQVLETGRLKNSKGEEISFKDTIIVLSSNVLREQDMAGEDLQDQKILRARLGQVVSPETGLPFFRQEFIGRLDQIVMFNSLSDESAKKILHKNIAAVNRDYRERGLSIHLDDAEADKIIATSYNPAMGGRSLRHLVSEHISRPLVDYLLQRCMSSNGSLAPETLTVAAQEGEIVLLRPDGLRCFPKLPVTDTQHKKATELAL